ncbi:MAG: hypothetical protein WHS38_00680 [Thermodesulforhabdaceae bacterium]
MIRIIVGIFLFVLVAINFSGCAGKDEPIDYDELTAEELEILYLHGRTFLLPKLCNAYAKWYLERPEAEWWLEGIERKEDAGSRFISYCTKAYYTSKDQEAARYLKFYYLLNLERKPTYLGDFLFYLKGGGEKGVYEAFVEHDAHFTAIAEHGLSIVNRLLGSDGTKSDSVSVKQLADLFNRYVTDLKQLESKVLIFSGTIHVLTLNMENIATVLNKTTDDFKAVSLLKEFRHQIESGTSFAIAIDRVVKAPENLNKDLLLIIVDGLNDFKKNKEKYFNQYESFLREPSRK